MKTRLQSIQLYLIFSFILAESAIYVAFNVIYFVYFRDAVIIKYSGILLCLAFAAASCFFSGKDGLFVTAAMFFTAVSDVFIFLLDDMYEVGLTAFIVVQVIYFARICFIKGELPFSSLAVRGALIIAATAAMWAGGTLSLLTGLVGVYFPLLLCNAAESAFLFRKSKRFICFFLGLMLFICCDICVGLYNFHAVGIPLSLSVQKSAFSAIWAFYLPSQTLIVLSAATGNYIQNPASRAET